MGLLLRLKLKDGGYIDLRREEGDIHVCSQDHCLVLPKCPGHQALDLYALLEPLGDLVEEKNYDRKGQELPEDS